MLIPKNYHASWDLFLTDSIRNQLDEIEKQIGNNYNPTNPDAILRFLTVDLTKVKVVWLGQDVYPAKGVATGRAFEVGGLTSWSEPFRQVSLKNIVRLLHKNYFGITSYKDIYSYKAIIQEMKEGHFHLLPPDKWFDSLEKQGALFLNSSFTCEIGKANSHKTIWEPFSQEVLHFISENYPSITWFLWGTEARAKKDLLTFGNFIESRHPMMCSESYQEDFLKSTCFLDTWREIDWLGSTN